MAKSLTRIQKLERRAAKILALSEVQKREERNEKVKQYIEVKMNRGHNREDATRMAKQLIDGQ